MRNFIKRITEKDKITHFSFCACLTIIASLISAGLGGKIEISIVEGVMVAMAAGFGKEFGDMMNGGRWDWYDIIADFAGAVAGVALLVVAGLI